MLADSQIVLSKCGRFILNHGPAQRLVLDAVEGEASNGGLVLIEGAAGSGKSNILSRVWRNADDRTAKLSVRELLAVNDILTDEDFGEVVKRAVLGALSENARVAIDDIFRFSTKADGSAYRPDAIVALLVGTLVVAGPGKTIIATAGDGEMPDDFDFPAGVRVSRFRIPAFGPDDYRCAFATCFGADNLSGVDFQELHRLARPLSAFHLNMICSFLHTEGVETPTTADVIEVLGDLLLKPNIDRREVNIILAAQSGLVCSA